MSTKTKRNVNDIPADFVICRDMNHSWKPYDGKIDKRKHVIVRVLRCERCKTLKHQRLSMKGNILPGGFYSYPVGYLVEGAGRATSDFRAKVRLRNIEDQQLQRV